jgi:hypothetical protein
MSLMIASHLSGPKVITSLVPLLFFGCLEKEIERLFTHEEYQLVSVSVLTKNLNFVCYINDLFHRDTIDLNYHISMGSVLYRAQKKMFGMSPRVRKKIMSSKW